MAPDVSPRFAASHLGLFCLPMSHKKDAWLMWVNNVYSALIESDNRTRAGAKSSFHERFILSVRLAF